MAYSNCPKCGFYFSWLMKWRLSTQGIIVCPQCGAALQKNVLSKKMINWGIIITFAPQIVLGLLSAAERIFHYTIPDIIELPLCLLFVVPPIIIGSILLFKGLESAKLEVVPEFKDGKPVSGE